MKNKIYTLICMLPAFVFAIFSPIHSHAKQISINRSLHNGLMKYSYEWVDQNNVTINTVFQLYATDVKRGMSEFKKFDEDELNLLIKNNMKKFIRLHAPSGINITYDDENEQLSFGSKKNVSKRKVERFMKRLEKENDKIYAKYFKDRYYNYNSENNTIRPAHGTISKRYVIAMRPVAKALLKNVKTKTSREITNHVLNFIQSIPYDTLEDVRNSNGAGFQTPYGVIQGNKGDCDSKSVMFAAIMRNIYPYARIVVIYVPGHALVGFDYKKGKNDNAIKIGETIFVLAEPVGPSMESLGKVTPLALSVIRTGNYSYEEVPY